MITKSQARVAVLLTNWQRERNLKMIVRALEQQVTHLNVYIWNNNYERSLRDDRLTVFNSSDNFRCWPRWFMASLACTDYVIVMDDDICPATSEFISAATEEVDTTPDQIVGIEGRHVALAPPHYRGCPLPKQQDVLCNIVLGRFMVMRRDLLARVPLVDPYWDWSLRGDDILVSYHIGFRHRLSKNLLKRCRNLKTGDESQWRNSGHFEQREDLVRHLVTTGVEIRGDRKLPSSASSPRPEKIGQ